MFDKLVESTKQKQAGRNKFYFATSLIYGTSLSLLAIGTIIWFNPSMAEANTIGLILMPPPIPAAPAPSEPTPSRPTPRPQFVPPTVPIRDIPDPHLVPPAPRITRTGTTVVGAEIFRGMAGPSGDGPSVLGSSKDEAPPPPIPTPTPKVEATPTPTPKPPEIVRMTSSMITGKALRKVQPPYPQIARAVRAEGSVPVQITISEEGRVLDATVVSGHPTLREAARQAALQWVFSPTVLSGKPVKVSGVISFNFMLN